MVTVLKVVAMAIWNSKTKKMKKKVEILSNVYLSNIFPELVHIFNYKLWNFRKVHNKIKTVFDSHFICNLKKNYFGICSFNDKHFGKIHCFMHILMVHQNLYVLKFI